MIRKYLGGVLMMPPLAVGLVAIYAGYFTVGLAIWIQGETNFDKHPMVRGIDRLDHALQAFWTALKIDR